jgi:hypothetical protein
VTPLAATLGVEEMVGERGCVGLGEAERPQPVKRSVN